MCFLQGLTLAGILAVLVATIPLYLAIFFIKPDLITTGLKLALFHYQKSKEKRLPQSGL